MINSTELYEVLLIGQYVFGFVTLISLLFIAAPYGRFVRKGWGPSIKALHGWVIMESPAILMISFWFFQSDFNVVSLIMLLIWQTHYLRRTLHYPFHMKGKSKPFPILLVIFAISFNMMNGYINGFYIFQKANYGLEWLYDGRFLLGTVIFYIGYYINRQSDNILSNLKKSPNDDYTIPYGGFFKYISCPHYFGEIIEWAGWAILTWSWAGFAFTFYTFANLAPRALSHHQWYKENFGDYPQNRKALIPFTW